MKILSRVAFYFFLSMSSSSAMAAWYDSNAVGTAPDWAYRVPIDLPTNTQVHQTIKLDVDFNALITSLGVSGTFDVNSPRIIRPNNALANQQEFTDVIYNGVIDPLNNGRGQIKFIAEDAGVGPYYLYFDVTANGAKPANSQAAINGDFEHSATPTSSNWSIAASNAGGNQNNETHSTNYGASYSNQVSCGEGNVSGANNSPHNDGSAATTTGENWHLLGYRDACEDGSGNEYIRLRKQFTVPNSNEGLLEFYFQMQGFDDANYDRMEITIDGAAINHTALGISNTALTVNTGYIGFKSTYSSTVRDAGWQKASLALAAYRGRTITLEIAMRFATDNSYRTWVKIDDVVWSLQTATLGTPEPFVQLVPAIAVQKTSVTIQDPVNGDNFPKAIPGAIVEYSLEPTNSGAGPADENTIVLTDAIPANTALVVSDIGAAGSGPVNFVNGATISGLSYSFDSLSSLNDGVSFSEDSGASFGYIPQPDGEGVDARITHIRVFTTGIFKAADSQGNPSFQVKFRVQLQ
jgi:uncharacterized repeat protein (TIGR01451 family)